MHPGQQALKAGDLIQWDPNGNGYYIMPRNRWFVESGRFDEKNAGGGLGAWDRDHHYDVWGKVRFRLSPYTADCKIFHTNSAILLLVYTEFAQNFQKCYSFCVGSSPPRLQPFMYGNHGVQCKNAGCSHSDTAGDVY